jgi:hypothetical protein
MRAASSQGKTPLPQLGTDETQVRQRMTPGALQNRFDSEPRESVLTQRRKDTKLGNFNHGWARIDTEEVAGAA